MGYNAEAEAILLQQKANLLSPKQLIIETSQMNKMNGVDFNKIKEEGITQYIKELQSLRNIYKKNIDDYKKHIEIKEEQKKEYLNKLDIELDAKKILTYNELVSCLNKDIKEFNNNIEELENDIKKLDKEIIEIKNKIESLNKKGE